MINVFKKQLKDLKEIVPDFYVANATCHFDDHSPHLHIVGVAVKENCKTGLTKQVGKTSIFTKESLVIIQDKMRKKCIEELNNLRNEVSTLESNKKEITKQVNKLNKDKTNITDEINKKKKINNKIIIKSKNQLLDDNKNSKKKMSI